MAGTWQISNDNNAIASGATSSISVSMSHAANALVVVACGIRLSSGSAVSTCSVGGVAATRLTAVSNTTIRAEAWAIFRPAASTGETVAVGITPINKHAFVAASFTGTDRVLPFDVPSQEVTGTGTASAVSLTRTQGAQNQRMLQIVANRGTTTISSVGAGQATISQAGTTGGTASTNAKVHLNFEDAPNSGSQTATASLSAAATNASLLISLLPMLTLNHEIRNLTDGERIKTTKTLTDIVRRIADTETTITTFARVLADFLRIEDIKTITKSGIQIFTVTAADALSIIDNQAKTIIKTLIEQVGELYDGCVKIIGKIVGCEPES